MNYTHVVMWHVVMWHIFEHGAGLGLFSVFCGVLFWRSGLLLQGAEEVQVPAEPPAGVQPGARGADGGVSRAL